MQLHNFYIDALERVLTWELPAESIPVAILSEAGLLAGLDSEQLGGNDLD